MKSYFVGKNNYYLCADTHFYEQSKISFDGFIINQYIVGTGGAELDTPSLGKEFEVEEIKYSIIDSKKTFGFIIVDISTSSSSSSSVININFKSVEDYKQKYIKYKNKYLQLKKSM